MNALVSARQTLALTPLNRPDRSLAAALIGGGVEVCLDLSCGPRAITGSGESARAQLRACWAQLQGGRSISLRLSREAGWRPEDLKLSGLPLARLERLLIPSAELSQGWLELGRPLWLEVYSSAELTEALRSAHLIEGLMLNGSEAAGRCGELGGFLLLQRALAEREAGGEEARALKLALRGGLSSSTGAAALTLGCDLLVLDERWLGCAGTEAPRALQALLPRLDASHSELLSHEGRPFRALKHPLWSSPNPLPLSPDHPWVSAPRGLHPAESLRRFCEALSSKLSALEGTLEAPLSVAQGPMTRVSDLSSFAEAVAEAGALPFLALSLLSPEKAEALLRETSARLAGRPWGVGVLGFAPPELRKAHLALIQELKPSAALIAGGRPSQSRALEEAGVPTYLHAPSPELLKGFIKAGARRFVFEGSECGGHIGPRTSLSLWAAQLEELERMSREGELKEPAELELWFAGGVHDQRSAAFVRALCAPLIAQGVRVGVLMGTAYLFTREAVESGAILEEYQRVALNLKSTTTLHTAPGHATRCAKTPFVEDFERARARLEAEGLEPRARWAQLEQLNVGRLRLASKGLERGETGLSTVSLEEQRARGMYMIGEVATLRHEVTTMSALHDEVVRGSAALLRARAESEVSGMSELISEGASVYDSSDQVAIVGISALFPSAEGLAAYWSLILDGRDAVTEVPDERWPKEIYYDPSAPAGERSASKWGAFLAPLAFDPMRYGLPPTTLTSVEPVQLLALEASARALEDAGYAALPTEEGRPFNRTRAGVVFGAEAGTDLANAYSLRGTLPQWVGPIPEHIDAQLPRLTEDSFAGVLANVISGRVANRFDLGGANYTVDAACAASLAALDAAVKELKSGGADLMICGGADLHNSVNDYLMFSSVHALSKTGRCKTFDSEADGITLGEGVSALVLKRLADAERDGDRVYAVIEGVGASSDGRSFGLTAPRKEGQQRAVERAYQRAQIKPSKVELVEAHGTGTVVGDRTELEALTELYSAAGVPARSVALGSVKSQIGHTKCAAGMAGLVKVALSIYHRTLSPTLHIKEPNKAYDPSVSPFNLHEQPQPWLSQERWGAVSAFGFGGTNFHAALRGADQGVTPKFLREEWRSEPLVLLGSSVEELSARARRWVAALDVRAAHSAQGSAPVGARLRDCAYSLWRDGSEALSRRGEAPPVGVVLLASDFEEARRALSWLAERPSEATPESVRLLKRWGEGDGERLERLSPERVAALFPGQGAQRVGMMSELALTFGLVSDRWLEHPRWARVICPPPALTQEEKKAQSAALTDTRNAQPALGLCDLAMWDLARSLGLEAAHLAGHSYGELVALSVAGAIPTERLAPISAARGEAILGAARGGDPGKMAAMRVEAARLEEALQALRAEDPRLEGVVIANLNAPKQSVISGPSEALELALEGLKRHKIRGRAIPVACAFHSGVVAAGGAEFASYLSGEPLRPLSADSGYQVWSNERAAAYPALSPEALGERLAAHIASPVRFVEQVEAMYEAGVRVFMEVGPGRILSKLVSDILGDRPHEVVALAPERGDLEELLRGLSALSALGMPVSWGSLFEGRATPQPLEELTAPHPAKLLWWVNGQRAWPARGELTRGLRPPQRPLGWSQGSLDPSPSLASTGPAPVVPSTYRPPQELSDIMSKPPSMPTPLSAPPRQSAELNSALGAYFENMRALAEAQQRVMLALMGQGGLPSAQVTASAHVSPQLSAFTSATSAAEPAQASEADEWWREVTSPQASGEALAPALTVTPTEGDTGGADQVAPQLSQALSAQPEGPEEPQDIGALLVDLVSERTGYPPEMLDHALDLEADLGVDSIKRIEILGALGERLGLAQDGEGEEMVEELAMMKSLGEMISWLHEKLSSAEGRSEEGRSEEGRSEEGSAQVDAPSVEEAPRLPKPEGEGLPRSVRAWVDAPLKVDQAQRWVTRETLSEALKAGRHQWSPSAPLSADLLALPDELSAHQLLWISREVSDWSALPSHALVSALLTLVREEWGSSGVPQSFTLACPWPTQKEESLALGALTGFLKTLWRERPSLSVRLLYLEGEAERGEELLCAELNEHLKEVSERLSSEEPSPSPAPKIARAGSGGRRLERYEERALEGPEMQVTSTTERGALLVTGGAKGITALCLTGLPLEGRSLLLCGRSAPLEEPSTLWLQHRVSLEELDWAEPERGLRKRLMGALPELSRAELAALLREGRSRAELSQSLNQLRASGAHPVYLSVDVTDQEALREAVTRGLSEAQARRELSEAPRVTEVIHGAGVIEDKKIADKSLESFERVWRVKVEGALSLLTVAPDARRWVMFSSVSSALGNQGQVDYAAANAALDALCLTLRAQGREALSIQWGPWGGAGMVSEVLARYYERAGIKLIKPAGGLRAFREEWASLSLPLSPQLDPITLRSWPFER